MNNTKNYLGSALTNIIVLAFVTGTIFHPQQSFAKEAEIFIYENYIPGDVFQKHFVLPNGSHYYNLIPLSNDIYLSEVPAVPLPRMETSTTNTPKLIPKLTPHIELLNDDFEPAMQLYVKRAEVEGDYVYGHAYKPRSEGFSDDFYFIYKKGDKKAEVIDVQKELQKLWIKRDSMKKKDWQAKSESLKK